MIKDLRFIRISETKWDCFSYSYPESVRIQIDYDKPSKEHVISFEFMHGGEYNIHEVLYEGGEGIVGAQRKAAEILHGFKKAITNMCDNTVDLPAQQVVKQWTELLGDNTIEISYASKGYMT